MHPRNTSAYPQINLTLLILKTENLQKIDCSERRGFENVLAAQADRLQLVATERVDLPPEVDKQASVAQRYSKRIQRDHKESECFGIEESCGFAIDGEICVVEPRVVCLKLEARREYAKDLHARRRQHEERQQQQ